MARPMLKLRCRMMEKEIDRSDCTEILGRSSTYWTSRIMGREYFDLGDVYKLCDMLDIPYREIPEYFPPLRSA